MLYIIAAIAIVFLLFLVVITVMSLSVNRLGVDDSYDESFINLSRINRQEVKHTK